MELCFCFVSDLFTVVLMVLSLCRLINQKREVDIIQRTMRPIECNLVASAFMGIRECMYIRVTDILLLFSEGDT